MVKELYEAIEANKVRSSARTERAKAYGPTYEKYIAFKRVVRSARGPHSKEYHHRIHIRGTAGGEDTVAPTAPAAPVQTP